MNFDSYESLPRRLGFHLRQALRRFMPRPVLRAFGRACGEGGRRIQNIYVINLDRQPRRWRRMQNELAYLSGDGGVALRDLTIRFSAIDAKSSGDPNPAEIEPVYYLSEQLFVEPQPLLTKRSLDDERIITSTRQEIAVARSHIEVWKLIAASSCDYALILEDDVYFNSGARRLINRAWSDLHDRFDAHGSIDMLYLSYREAGPETKKLFVSDALCRPVRGLWQMSGYVLSNTGAQRLLELMPVRGPVDLWINHQFDKINVFATSRSAIDQRPDAQSDNNYSIQAILATTGALTRSNPNIFKRPSLPGPIIAWEIPGSGASALDMALSILVYRCCSEVSTLPKAEHDALLKGRRSNVFDAYVNVEAVYADLARIVRAQRSARLIVSCAHDQDMRMVDGTNPAIHLGLLGPNGTGGRLSHDPLGLVAWLRLDSTRLLVLNNADPDKWGTLCGFLGCERPDATYPSNTGHRPGLFAATHPRADSRTLASFRKLRFDSSPWIAPKRRRWAGGRARNAALDLPGFELAAISDCLTALDPSIWKPLADTFPSNLALFAPGNLSFSDEGARLTFRKEQMGVRDYTSASICSVASYLYGRFEAELRAARCSGLITAVFLHRFFPRQEIDIELLGYNPTKLLINVYYNPGDDGAELNYGYRGTPVQIDLGFDASEDFHRYAIEWEPTGIRWFVDDKLIHERASWDPTPIPHLPMQFFINLWSSRSEEFAGKLALGGLSAHSDIRSIRLQGHARTGGS